jgi:hypothetical protein
MDSQISALFASAITGACAITAATTVAFVNLKAQSKKEEIERLRNENSKHKKLLVAAYRQIASFHTLEDEYSMEMEKMGYNQKKQHPIKIEFRDRVKNRGYERPDWSANEALAEAQRISE